MQLLHIFNGDSSYEMFKTTSLKGDALIWREMLSEGKSDQNIQNPKFYKNRKLHFQHEYDVSETEYDAKVSVEFNKLNSAPSYDEVILWFEYDLFCQINIMAALSMLVECSYKNKVSLICVGKFTGQSRLLGLGELKPESFNALLDERKPLQDSDLAFAQKIWKAYSAGDHLWLYNNQGNIPKAFEYYSLAINAHFKRFPSPENGLNTIETKIMNMIRDNSGEITWRAIIRQLLLDDQEYGLGDMIYDLYLKKLSPLYDIREDNYYINALGQEVLDHKVHFGTLRSDYYFGGASIKDFNWDSKMQKLTRPVIH